MARRLEDYPLELAETDSAWQLEALGREQRMPSSLPGDLSLNPQMNFSLRFAIRLISTWDPDRSRWGCHPLEGAQ